MSQPASSADRDRCAALLRGVGVEAMVASATSLPGGVSSDLFRVELASRTLCVKFACARLRVAADWVAPVARSRTEYDWLALVARRFPAAVPALIGYDEAGSGFAMAHLPPGTHPVWKARLLAGTVEPEVAATVGRLLGAIHAWTAGDAAVRDRFATQADFRALRLEPYLGHAAAQHREVAPALEALSTDLDAARIALVHGDVSPKNILCGPAGPVLLDAECAVYGDPAFDVAFCLTHLAAKALHMPTHRLALVEAGAALWRAHRAEVAWEPPARIEARVARLLPALALARVDGKSPLEYLDMDQKRDLRANALARLLAPLDRVEPLLAELAR